MFKLRTETQILPHQTRFVEFQLERKTVGLFDEPGTGKTLETLAAICEVGGKALVVPPPFLANTWHTEISRWTHLEVGKDIDIVPYTMLKKRISSFEGYRYIAFDEAHALKNLEAQRTQTVHAYLDDHQPEFLTYATGTPIMNRVPEFYSFLVMLAGYDHVTPNILTRYNSYYKFCMRFCNVSEQRFGGRSVMNFSGIKNVEELKEYIKPWSIKRKSSEVLNLPGMEAQTIYANYKDDPALEKAWLEHTSKDAPLDPTAKKDAAIATAHFTAELAHSYLESDAGPIVIFSDHRDPVSIMERELSGKGWRVASIMGGDSATSRNDIVTRFQNGQLDVLVATYGAASTGLTLTRSNLGISNDPPWVPSTLRQARDRIHRISQERSTRWVYVAGSKVAGRIIASIVAKMKTINTVMEG